MAHRRESTSPGFGVRVLTWIAAPAVVVIPLVEWIPGIADDVRPWVVVGLAGIGFIAVVVSSLVARRHRSNARDLDALRQAFDPGHALDYVTNALFADGAWRLTIYRKRMARGNKPELVKLWAHSSDRDHRDTAIDRIVLIKSILKESLDANLSNPQRWHANQSGSFEASTDSTEWREWRFSIFGGREALPGDRSTLNTRKFAWFAVQDPDSRIVVAVLAESTSPVGINFEVLNDSSTPVWLLLIARLSAGAGLVPESENGPPSRG